MKIMKKVKLIAADREFTAAADRAIRKDLSRGLIELILNSDAAEITMVKANDATTIRTAWNSSVPTQIETGIVHASERQGSHRRRLWHWHVGMNEQFSG